ncbi:hypothetical protein KBA73_03925 [Patescibacteria group bacterium]|nr:hypothetical protein [Patescibacteria group bacterium]
MSYLFELAVTAAGGVPILVYFLRRKAIPPPPPPEEVEELPVPVAPTPQAPIPIAPQEPLEEPTPEPEPLSTPEMIEAITTNMTFTTKRVLVGHREVGEVLVEHRLLESTTPADEYEVRGIHHPGEFAQLLPSERTKPPEMALLRLLSGEAQIAQHFEHVAIYDPIYEPIYTELKLAVYVLMDNSPSMYKDDHAPRGERDWRIVVAKGVVLALLERCLQEGSVFLFRWFSGSLSRLYRVQNRDEAANFIDYLSRLTESSDTNITRGIRRAINDCEAEELDEARIMMITDGEDNRLNPSEICARLVETNASLHSVLIDVHNQSLQDCSNVYQVIPTKGKILPLVVRADPS